MASFNPPSGFRDFLNNEARRRMKLMNVISSVYESFGFLPIETPVLENLDVLLGKGGGDENEKLIFKILKRGEKLEEALQTRDENKIAEFGLRFDLTVPLSRVVANYRNEIRFPWKVFHIGPVWRAERAQKGRFREFIQCDVDVIGAKGVGAEIEVIQAVVHAIHQVGASGFELRLNDRRLLQAMAEKFGFKGDSFDSFAIILDKKDKLEASEILRQMEVLAGSSLPDELKQWIEGDLSLSSVASVHPEAAHDLQTLIQYVNELKLPLTRVVFDPSLVRGMGYYTGPVFELRHSSAGYSFGGGGRYDKLIGKLSGQEISACGFSIGFERLALLLEESEKNSEAGSSVVFLPVFDESLRGKVLGLAQDLRAKGYQADVFPDQAKIKNQFRFASEKGYRWVLIAGQEEWNTQVFKLKDFKSGEEVPAPRAELESILARGKTS